MVSAWSPRAVAEWSSRGYKGGRRTGPADGPRRNCRNIPNPARGGEAASRVVARRRNPGGWAVGMYDENLRHPELVRLMTWLRLERRPVGRLSDRPDDGPKLAAIAQAQAAGHLRAGDPADLMGLVIAIACAWSPVSSFYAATADEPAADHDRRRTLLHDCVARAVAP
ncbi:hypothetical protein [Microbispora rosea]